MTVMNSSHRRRGRDKTVLSCARLRCEIGITILQPVDNQCVESVDKIHVIRSPDYWFISSEKYRKTKANWQCQFSNALKIYSMQFCVISVQKTQAHIIRKLKRLQKDRNRISRTFSFQLITRNAFCGTWYLPHSLVHNERIVTIIIAGCIAHACSGHISTSGLKSDVTIVFIDPDFLEDGKRLHCINASSKSCMP